MGPEQVHSRVYINVCAYKRKITDETTFFVFYYWIII